MDLVNETELDARLFTGGLGPGVHAGIVVARATYRIEPDGTLSPSSEPWPVLGAPMKTKYGTFAESGSVLRRGCDLVVCGDVVLTRAAPEATVTARVGAHTSTLRVVGDRVWERRGDGSFAPSAPVPFERMSLGWERAFGGRCELEGQAGEHPLNPHGKGFVLTPDHDPEGVPLPNLEHTGAEMQAPLDRPLPASWAPVERSVAWHVMGAAAEGQVDPTDAVALTKLLTRAGWGSSPPYNVMPVPPGGAAVRVELGADTLTFTLPDEQLSVHVRVGARRGHRPTSTTGVWIFASERIAVITYESRFRYRLRRGDRRVVTLSAM